MPQLDLDTMNSEDLDSPRYQYKLCFDEAARLKALEEQRLRFEAEEIRAANDGEKPYENEENIGVTSIGNDNTSDSDDDHDIGYRTVGRDPNNPTIKAGDVIGWHCTMKE